jgi:hypothetical protein
MTDAKPVIVAYGDIYIDECPEVLRNSIVVVFDTDAAMREALASQELTWRDE